MSFPKSVSNTLHRKSSKNPSKLAESASKMQPRRHPQASMWENVVPMPFIPHSALPIPHSHVGVLWGSSLIALLFNRLKHTLAGSACPRGQPKNRPKMPQIWQGSSHQSSPRVAGGY
jgi:hypothetical protein